MHVEIKVCCIFQYTYFHSSVPHNIFYTLFVQYNSEKKTIITLIHRIMSLPKRMWDVLIHNILVRLGICYMYIYHGTNPHPISIIILIT